MSDSEEDLTQSMEEAMARYPDTYAVLVRRHGVCVSFVAPLPKSAFTNFASYVWGDNVAKAKTQAERSVHLLAFSPILMAPSLDYIFRLAVEMRTLGLPWTADEARQRGPLPGEDLNAAKETRTPKSGRPKRSNGEQENLNNGETPRTRGPGRPRRSLGATLTDVTTSDSLKKGPGRPTKDFLAKKRPGRPRKTL